MERKKKRRKNGVIEKNTYGKMHGDLAYERIDICLFDPRARNKNLITICHR